jgi:hypothetical protein
MPCAYRAYKRDTRKGKYPYFKAYLKDMRGDLLDKDRLHHVILRDPEGPISRSIVLKVVWSCIDTSGFSQIHLAGVECCWRQLTYDLEGRGGRESNMFPHGRSVDRGFVACVFNSDIMNHTNNLFGWSALGQSYVVKVDGLDRGRDTGGDVIALEDDGHDARCFSCDFWSSLRQSQAAVRVRYLYSPRHTTDAQITAHR